MKISSICFVLLTALLKKSLASYCIQGDYFFIENSFNTFDLQRQNCQSRGGDLASFQSGNQLDALVRLLDAQQLGNSFWLGIEHVARGNDTISLPGDFVYSADVAGDNPDFFALAGVGIAPWSAGQPNGQLGQFDQCVALERITGAFEFFDVNCDIFQPAICRVPAACSDFFGDVAVQCIEENGSTDMYFASDFSTSNGESEFLCGELFSGERVSYDSFEAFAIFTVLQLNFLPLSFWTDIVLSEPGIPESANYLGNGPTNFLINDVQSGNSPPWAVGEPSGTFVVVDSSGELSTRDPGDAQSLACRLRNSQTCLNIDPSFTVVVSTGQTEPPTDSNEPPRVDTRQFCFAEDNLNVVFSFSDFDSAEFICDDFSGGQFDGIETLEEFNKLTVKFEQFLQEQELSVNSTGLWVGFRNNGNDTSSSEFESFSGNDIATNFISALGDGQFPWAAGQPSGDDVCVRLFRGLLEVAPCSSNNVFLCMRRDDDFCAGETSCFGNTQARAVAADFVTFDQAQAKCEEFGANSGSFAITSQEEYNAFFPLFQEARNNFGQGLNFWTGYQTGEASNNPANYSHISTVLKGTNDFVTTRSNGVFPWDGDQPAPENNCVILNERDLLQTANCDFSFPVLCTKQYAQECATQRVCTENNVEFLYYPEEFDSATHGSNCFDLLGNTGSAAVMDSILEFEQVRDAFAVIGVSAWTDYEIFNDGYDGYDDFSITDRNEASPFLSTTSFNAFPWAADEPNVSEFECLDFGAELTSQDCGDLKPGICRINNSPFCFEPQPDSRCLNGVTYTFIPNSERFDEAQQSCVNRGGNLVTPSTPVEMALITSLLTDNEVNRAWSGIFAPSPGSDPDTLDYTFINNSTDGLDFIHVPVGVHPWFAGQPVSFDFEENFPLCAFLASNFDGAELIVTSCFEDTTFICEIESGCEGLVVPDEWFCDPLLFNDGEVCNCRCGAVDPDCVVVPPAPQPECDEGVVCNEIGTCDLEVPPEWICPIESYNSLDGCDCNCGAPDPDCDTSLVPDQRNNNCEGSCVDGICLDFDILNPTQIQCTGEDADFYFHTPLTFEEASAVCDQFLLLVFQGEEDEFPEAGLAPIISSEDIAAFLTVSKGFDLTTGVHVGIVANSDGTAPVLPEGFEPLFPVNATFVTQRQVGEFPWAAGEPNEVISGKTCTALGADGLLFDTSCDVKRQFICRVPQLCEDEDEAFGLTCLDRDLIGAESFVTYSNIAESCNDGSALLAVASEDNLNAFNRIMSQDDFSGLWAALDAIELGSNSTPSNFRFFNENQEGIEFVSNVNRSQFPWDINEPDNSGDCAIVETTSGLLQDVSCTDEFPAVCRFVRNFCNGVTENEGTFGPTPSPIIEETEAPTTSPTQSPTERVSTCSRRTFGITNPTKFF